MPKSDLWNELVAEYDREKRNLHGKGKPVELAPDGTFVPTAPEQATGMVIGGQALLVSIGQPRVLAGLYLKTFGGRAPETMESVSTIDGGGTLPWTEALELAGQAVDEEIRATMLDATQTGVTCSACGAEGKVQLWRWKFRNPTPTDRAKRIWICPPCYAAVGSN